AGTGVRATAPASPPARPVQGALAQDAAARPTPQPAPAGAAPSTAPTPAPAPALPLLRPTILGLGSPWRTAGRPPGLPPRPVAPTPPPPPRPAAVPVVTMRFPIS